MFLAENTEQNLNFGAGLRLLIIIILIPTGSDGMHHIGTCFLSLELTHAILISGPQIAIRRVTAFNNYKGSLQM